MLKVGFRDCLAATMTLLCTASLAQASSFTDALESAYERNPRITAERARLEQTDEGVSQALSNLRPNVSANYAVGKQRTTINNGDESDNIYQNQGLSISEPLFRGGATWSSYNAAKQRVRAGQFRLSGVEQQVLLDAITAYMDVVTSSSILELSRNNREVLQKQLTASQDRFQVGEVTRTDVAQSEARLSNAKAQVVAAEGQVISAIAAFERVIGHKPEKVLTLPDPLPELPAKLSEALERARATNPQLLSAVYEAKSAKYDIDTNIATLLPQVALVGSMNRQYGVGQPGQSQFAQDRIGVNVTIPLYQSGAEYSRVREAKSAARERQHQEIDTQQSVDEAVTQSWEQLETAVATINARQAQIEAAKISLEGVQAEQQAGSRTVLDVLDAEQELFVAKTQLVRSQRDRVVAAYTLAQNLGQLTPQMLGLKSEIYDPAAHYDSVKWQVIGF
jgi:TolC family type I secretion outer membrane protein